MFEVIKILFLTVKVVSLEAIVIYFIKVSFKFRAQILIGIYYVKMPKVDFKVFISFLKNWLF